MHHQIFVAVITNNKKIWQIVVHKTQKYGRS